MGIFKKLTKKDIETVYPFFEKEKSLSCDCSIGGCFIWCDFFSTEFAITDDTILFKIKENEELHYTYPLGENIESALSIIEADAEETKTPLSFFVFDQNALDTLKKRYPDCVIREKREYFDYIYDYTSLSTFKGKKLSGQRNHVNKFKRLYPDYTFEEINDENKKELSEFFKSFSHKNEKTNTAIEMERIKIFDLIENLNEYHQFGGILRVASEIVGFSIAEKIGETMFVHIEKADIKYEGVYQMLVSSFASHFADEKTVYINREDDTGDEGLRKSKLSYHPLFLLEKYILDANI